MFSSPQARAIPEDGSHCFAPPERTALVVCGLRSASRTPGNCTVSIGLLSKRLSDHLTGAAGARQMGADGIDPGKALGHFGAMWPARVQDGKARDHLGRPE